MPLTVDVRRAEPADREFIERVLRTNDLVVPDGSAAIDETFVCEADGDRIGTGALERCADAALLRSVAIDESVRGRGYGTALCARLLEHADANGIADIYLFTATASEFFATLGFEPTDRESVPESIRTTNECRDRCRSTAVCMNLTLTSGDGADGSGER